MSERRKHMDCTPEHCLVGDPSPCLLFQPEAERTDVLPDVRIAVTRSAGDDRAVVVFIDTQFEPFAAGADDLGLRVLLNDNEVYVGKAYDFGDNHEAETQHFQVRLDEIPYTGKEL